VGTASYYQALTNQAKRIGSQLNELLEAIEDRDLVEVADAIIDLEFTVLGAAHLAQFNFNGSFGAVADNNDTKFTKDAEQAQITAMWYTRNGVETEVQTAYEDGEAFYTVHRLTDNKSMKPKDFVEVDITALAPEPASTFLLVGEDAEKARTAAEKWKEEYDICEVASCDAIQGDQRQFITDLIMSAPDRAVLFNVINGAIVEVIQLGEDE
jgi:hypothetical protein